MSEPELIPIFPLSNVVLFPRVKTPLHLFEPRYRQLAREVLEGERRIAMTVVRPEHAEEMIGDPPIFPVGCAGVITESSPAARRPLQHRSARRVPRAHRQGELPREGSRLYRVARAVRLDETYPDAERARVARLRAAIVADVGVLVRATQPTRSHPFDPGLFAGVDDEVFVNAVSNAFAFPPEEKQSLLEADSIPERYARLASALSFQRLEIEGAGRGGSQLH